MASVRKNKIIVKWKGKKNLYKRFEKAPKEVRFSILQALDAIALILQNTCRQGIQRGPKTGRVYRKSKGVYHQASKAGEFPATDTGTLVRSIFGESKKESMEAILSANTKYAKHLELGTKDMHARPFLVPSLHKTEKKALRILKTYIKAGIKK